MGVCSGPIAQAPFRLSGYAKRAEAGPDHTLPPRWPKSCTELRLVCVDPTLILQRHGSRRHLHRRPRHTSVAMDCCMVRTKTLRPQNRIVSTKSKDFNYVARGAGGVDELAANHASDGARTLAHRAPLAHSLGRHGLLHLAAQAVLVQSAAFGGSLRPPSAQGGSLPRQPSAQGQVRQEDHRHAQSWHTVGNGACTVYTAGR